MITDVPLCGRDAGRGRSCSSYYHTVEVEARRWEDSSIFGVEERRWGFFDLRSEKRRCIFEKIALIVLLRL